MGTNAQSRTRRDHKLWDDRVNSLWGGQRPVLSPAASLVAARKLYRHAMGKAWPGKWGLTSGNRNTWPRWQEEGRRMVHVFLVNPDETGDGGLRGIVHSISHYCHRRLHPHDKPHSIRQLRLEAKLTRFAIARVAQWTAEPAVEAEPVPTPKPDKVVQRYRRMVARRDRWTDQLARAKRLAAKSEAEVRAYERRHGDRVKA